MELLNEIAPRITRAAVIRDPIVAAQMVQMGAVTTIELEVGNGQVPH